jgi:hypothetical protein
MKLLIFIILITIIYIVLLRQDCDCNEKMTNIVQESLQESEKYFNEKSNNDPYISISDNEFSDDNTDSINAQFYKNSINNLEELPSIKKNKSGRVNLNKLQKCTLPIKADYSANINNMVNDGKKITQDMVKSDEQKSMISNQKHDLRQISWTKSRLNWYGKKIPLEIPEKRSKRKCCIIYPYWKNKEN